MPFFCVGVIAVGLLYGAAFVLLVLKVDYE